MRPLLCLIALTVIPLAASCSKDEPPPPPPPPEPDCGNGLLEEGEVCEGMPTPVGCNPNTCQIQAGWACTPEPPDTQGGTGGTFEPIEWVSTCEELDTCGDGVVDPGEQCDDGDMTLGDGCSMCTVDPLYTCEGEPSVCRQCGDGFLDEGEECDDGEENDEVGMDSPGCEQCRVVEGWNCFPSQAQVSICGPRCGDGLWFDESVDGVTVGTAEGCDDGNMLDGDGCDARCEVEAGCTCSGPSAGTSTCTCGMDGDSGSTTGDMGGSESGSTGDMGGSESGSSTT